MALNCGNAFRQEGAGLSDSSPCAASPLYREAQVQGAGEVIQRAWRAAGVAAARGGGAQASGDTLEAAFARRAGRVNRMATRLIASISRCFNSWPRYSCTVEDEGSQKDLRRWGARPPKRKDATSLGRVLISRAALGP